MYINGHCCYRSDVKDGPTDVTTSVTKHRFAKRAADKHTSNSCNGDRKAASRSNRLTSERG